MSGEAQARGFEHGHDKKTAIPKGHHLQYGSLKRLCQQAEKVPKASHPGASPHENSEAIPHDTERPSGANTTSDALPLASTEAQMLTAMENYNQQLIPYVTSRQYESSILPGRQVGLNLPASPFSSRQQQQSRYDGQYEVNDTTKRDLVPVVVEEPSAHIAREARRATAAARPLANAYSQVPLTGSSLPLLPAYHLTQNIGKPYRIIRHGELIDELEPGRATTLDDACCFSEDGTFQHFLVPCKEIGKRRPATLEDLANDAIRYQEAFTHDFRWLSAHNHDHTCAATCVKK